ncbi:Lysophospholipid acyltransferase LPEAT2 [Camellia lanceoleosa]|uniref:Lysophospholipid acyltransferase LPEAT2 n=1 Tax=Camellia lanceoleosa TaxID=1840588 RepID=A0ACC0IHP6_9ERIC|nr:Lysophospholipid acyltransferase LPEAT2 [Camellia lanceoleosa]
MKCCDLGAFVPGYPVHPVIVCYPLVHFNQSWGNIALGKLVFRMFIVSRCHGGQHISSLVLDCCSVLIGYYNCTNISFLWVHHAAYKCFQVQTG